MRTALVLISLLVIGANGFFTGPRGGRSHDWLLKKFGRAAENKAGTTVVKLPEGIRETDIVNQHSFYPPLLEDRYFSRINNWDFGHATTVTDSYVRLTPAKQSREGWIWNDCPSRLPSWIARFGLRIHALGALGADGLAFWLTETKATSGGPLFGAPKTPKGLGIIFDSYDNDQRKDNPAVHVILGDGSEVFHGSDDLRNQRLGGCEFPFRNTDPNDVVHVTVEYGEGTLTILLQTMSKQIQCSVLSPITLPTNYHFGFTAHTGSLADNHDVLYFVVTAREADRIAEEKANEKALEEAAQQKFDHEFERMQKESFSNKDDKPQTPPAK